MKKWYNLIQENETEILEHLATLFKDSLYNSHLTFHLELYDNGILSIWFDCNSNSYKSSNLTGDSICIMSYNSFGFTDLMEEYSVELAEEWVQNYFEDNVNEWCNSKYRDILDYYKSIS